VETLVFRANRIGREQPSAVDLALLAKGFYLVAAPIDTQPGPAQREWDATYKVLTDHGFSKKPALEGIGASAREAYAWAIEKPGQSVVPLRGKSRDAEPHVPEYRPARQPRPIGQGRRAGPSRLRQSRSRTGRQFQCR